MSSSTALRAANMVKASMVADAAAMPLHWIYNQADIATKVGDMHGAFFSPPSCPFYEYPFGVLSPYGDESIPLLQSIASVGEFHVQSASEAMFNFFRDYTDSSSKGYAGRLNHAPKLFVESRAEGKPWAECAADDFQANGITKVPIIVARYAGSPDLLQRVDEMVRILQSNSLSMESSRLYAIVLDLVLRNNIDPASALNRATASTTLSPYESAVLKLVNSDEKIVEWVRFAEQIDAVPLENGESPFLKMAAKGAVLIAYLSKEASFDDILSSIAPDLPSSKGGDIVRRINAASPEMVQLTVTRVVKALGLSCALPGENV